MHHVEIINHRDITNQIAIKDIVIPQARNKMSLDITTEKHTAKIQNAFFT